MEGIIAQRYAVSLFEVAQEFKITDEILEDLKSLKTVFRENEDFFKLLNIPTLSKEEKVSMLDKVFEGRINVYMLNFLKILCEKGRIPHFYEIASYYTKLYNKENNIKEVLAITAVPLSENLKTKLINKLAEITGSRILLENKVDPKILGGVVIKMDDNQFDSSVKGRLERLKSSLNAQNA